MLVSREQVPVHSSKRWYVRKYKNLYANLIRKIISFVNKRKSLEVNKLILYSKKNFFFFV